MLASLSSRNYPPVEFVDFVDVASTTLLQPLPLQQQR
jgi:hypothetical protein